MTRKNITIGKISKNIPKKSSILSKISTISVKIFSANPNQRKMTKPPTTLTSLQVFIWVMYFRKKPAPIVMAKVFAILTFKAVSSMIAKVPKLKEKQKKIMTQRKWSSHQISLRSTSKTKFWYPQCFQESHKKSILWSFLNPVISWIRLWWWKRSQASSWQSAMKKRHKKNKKVQSNPN